MINTFFEQTFEEEFSKIPAVFRIRRKAKAVFCCISVVLLIVSIRFFQMMMIYNLADISAEKKASTMGVILGSWIPFAITNVILIILAVWLIIGTVYEHKAFKRASDYDRLHKDWERDLLAKKIREAKSGKGSGLLTRRAREIPVAGPGFCPKCGLPTEAGEDLCELCRSTDFISTAPFKAFSC